MCHIYSLYNHKCQLNVFETCYTMLLDLLGYRLTSNDISSAATAVYFLMLYAAATAGVLIGQLSPSVTSRRRPRLSNSSQLSTGPQFIRLPAMIDSLARYADSSFSKLSCVTYICNNIYSRNNISSQIFYNLITIPTKLQ